MYFSFFAEKRSSDGDEPDYGSDSEAPAGVWYAPGSYDGPAPSPDNSASPAAQPYEGGPFWVSEWVDTTNPDNCVIVGPDGQLSLNPDGCASGYWRSVEITQDPTPIDYNNILETDPSSESISATDESIVYPSDNIEYAEYQQQTPWPVIKPVISFSQFVKYDSRQCFILAKEQIGVAGYTVSGWSTTNGLIFTTYNEGGAPQVNYSQTKKAITYINEALQAGIPVLAGVDYVPGWAAGNLDHTTDHFIVIVGSGTDSNGKFYQFYDNGTNQGQRGTNAGNKLYYNESSGLISGYTHVGKLSNYLYKLTQVRKSIKK